MCTVLLQPGVNPTAVNKCIISYRIVSVFFNVKPGGVNHKDLNILIV